LTYSRIWEADPGSEATSYQVRLTTTQLASGGLRWWFLCPLLAGDRACGCRVAKLYLPMRQRYFGCRRCHALTYTSCRESRKYDGLCKIVARNLGADFASVRRIMARLDARWRPGSP
jgi:hypothetical protein